MAVFFLLLDAPWGVCALCALCFVLCALCSSQLAVSVFDWDWDLGSGSGICNMCTLVVPAAGDVPAGVRSVGFNRSGVSICYMCVCVIYRYPRDTRDFRL